MKKTLKSTVMHTSKRSYFFNLIEIDNGKNILSITENIKTSLNEYQRKEIIVFKEDIEQFLKVALAFVEE